MKKVRNRKGISKKHPRPTRAALGLLALAFLALLILFGKLPSFFWGNSTLNLVVQSGHVYLASYNPREGSLSVLKVPDETYVDVPLGFGRWPMRSVYQLGQAENPPIGTRLLQDAIGLSFGVPVDGYLQTAGNFETAIESVRQNPLQVVALAGQSRTNLSFVQAFQFWWGVRGVRFDRLQVADLGKSKLTSWALLPDGSRVLNLDRANLDQFIKGQFTDPKLGDEALSIGILNTTGHPGMAERAARVVGNMGGRVIFTASSPDRLQKSQVSGKPSYTLTRLSQVFAPACVPKRGFLFGLFGSNPGGCRADTLSVDLSRADVVVALGEDYFARYNNR